MTQLKRKARKSLSVIGVILTTSLKVSANLSSILLIIMFLLTVMSGVFANTASLVNGVEATFKSVGLTTVFAVSYLIVRYLTAHVSTKDSYSDARQLV